jgi:PAS domain S-box-containing protein
MPKERIIIAVNDISVAKDLTAKLASLGYVVVAQVDQSEATIQKVGELLPDLVLVDIHLKGRINGVAVAKQINSEFDIPVIFISAQADTVTLQNALPAQAYGFVLKPFEVRDLKSSVALALYKHSMTSKLRESEERYALAVRAANDGIWDWNLKTNLIYFSTRWKEMLGFKEHEIGNNPDEWFKLIHPGDRKEVQENLVYHLKGLSSHFEYEYRIQHSNGAYLWVLSRGLAVRGGSGTPYRMAGSNPI